MKLKKHGLLPHYFTAFSCACSVEEARRRVLAAAEREANDLTVISRDYQEPNQISLAAHTGSLLYRNSYLPEMEVTLLESGEQTNLSIHFQLSPMIRLLMPLSLILGAIIHWALLWHISVLPLPVIFLPLILPVVNYAVCILSFRRSVREVLRTLYDALTST